MFVDDVADRLGVSPGPLIGGRHADDDDAHPVFLDEPTHEDWVRVVANIQRDKDRRDPGDLAAHIIVGDPSDTGPDGFTELAR